MTLAVIQLQGTLKMQYWEVTGPTARPMKRFHNYMIAPLCWGQSHGTISVGKVTLKKLQVT